MTDKEKYQQKFIEFQNELLSFLYRLVTNRQESEDLVQETYIRAFQKLDSFQGNSTFKTWVFSIATNLAKDSLRAQERWGENWMDLVKNAHVSSKELMQKKMGIASSPDFKFDMAEHLNYCFSCTSKTLLLTNQICLLLKEIYGFKIAEIMLVLNLSEGKVKHAIADSRNDMKRIFSYKCALINKEGVCSQCTGLNNIFNSKQDTQMKINRLKIIKEKKQGDYDHLLNLRLEMSKAIDPINGGGSSLHNYLLENSPKWAKKYKS